MPRVSASAYGSDAAAKKRIKRASSASGGLIRRLKADETARFRFLTEPREWVEANQHFVKETSQFAWCFDKGCEECAKGNRPSRRTLINAVEVSDGNKVVVVQVVASLAKQLYQKYERFGTMVDRDYDLTREGSGMDDTVYSVDYSGPKKKDLTRFQPHDILEILDSEAQASGSDDDDDEDEEPRSTKGSRPKGKAPAGGIRRKAKDDDEDEYEDDEADEEQEDFSELDRSELKREIKKLDPDFVANKSQSDEDLRAYLWDLTYAEDEEDGDEEDEDEVDDAPRGSQAKASDRSARRESRRPHPDEDDEEENEEDAEEVAPRDRRASVKPKSRSGLSEFKKSTTSNPGPRKLRRTR